MYIVALLYEIKIAFYSKLSMDNTLLQVVIYFSIEPPKFIDTIEQHHFLI